jgi:hypothetical protein
MPLNEKEKVLVLNAMLTVAEERLRAADRVTDLVRQSIKERDAELKLEATYDALASLIPKKTAEETKSDIEQLRKEVS